MRSVAAFSIRHKWVVVTAWLFFAVVGAATASTAIGRLDYTYSTPGQPGYEANLHISQRFGIDATFEPTLAVLHLPAGLTMRTAAGRAAAGRTFAAAARPGVVTVTDYADTGNPKLVTDGGRTTWAVLSLANPDKGPGVGAGDNLGAILRAAAPRGASVTVTGFAQLLAAGGGPGGVSVLAATVIGGALALLLLLLVYGSAIAVVPLLMAVPAILVTFLCELGLTHITAVSYFVEYLVALVGLGVAVDYSLLVVVRWREERGRGLSNEAAIATSGMSIVPTPMLRRKGTGSRMSDSRPIATVAPLSSTALPARSAAAPIAASLLRPRPRSSRHRMTTSSE